MNTLPISVHQGRKYKTQHEPSRHSSVGKAFVCGTIVPSFEPTSACLQVCAREQLGCHAGRQEFCRCHTRGEPH